MDAKVTGKIIQSKRKELGLTQIQLAEKLNVSNRAVSKWENGDGYPDVSILEDISKVLDISIDELLTGEKATKEVEYVEINQDDKADNSKLNFVITSIIGFAILLGQTIACVAAEMALIGYRPFYMFVEIYLLSAVIIAYVVAMIVYLVGFAKLKYKNQVLSIKAKISFLSFISVATISPVAIAFRMIRWHSYLLSYIILGLWVLFAIISVIYLVKKYEKEK